MKKADLTGKRFGRLLVLYESEPYITKKGNKLTVWHWKCDCGKEKDIRAANLSKGTKSCGCLANELASARRKKDNTYDLSGSYGIGDTNINDNDDINNINNEK